MKQIMDDFFQSQILGHIFVFKTCFVDFSSFTNTSQMKGKYNEIQFTLP